MQTQKDDFDIEINIDLKDKTRKNWFDIGILNSYTGNSKNKGF
jgi:hypothetical protein